MGQIRWTEKASSNLENIYSFIAKDSPFYATQFTEALIDALDILRDNPICGRIVPELENFGFRELIHKGYRMVNQISNDSNDIEILAIVHSSRDLNSKLIK